MEQNYTNGDVLLLNRGTQNKERMIIRYKNPDKYEDQYLALDTYTGNVVSVEAPYEVFNTAAEVVDAYIRKGYSVTKQI